MEPFMWQLGGTASVPSNLSDVQKHVPPISRVALRRFRPPANTSVFVSEARYLESDKIRGQIIDQSGPFLFSGNWWDEKSWARAEWDMQLEEGDLIRAHETEGVWKVDGIYD
jgi:hypothetical protein